MNDYAVSVVGFVGLCAALAGVWFFSPCAKANPVRATLTKASWYGKELRGSLMANGEPFNPDAYTCASWDYPFGTVLVVRRITLAGHALGDAVVVRVTDRGPARRLAYKGRRLDLSRAAFEKIASLDEGVVWVSFIVISSPAKQ